MAAALAACLGTIVAVLGCGVLFAALGHGILRLSGVAFSADAEDLLGSIALGVIAVQVALFFAQLFPHIGLAVAVCFALALLAGARDFAPVLRKTSQILRRVRAGSPLEKFLASCTGAVLFIGAVASMAPLTGSDALHYHFTAPRLIVESGFDPNFFKQGFFCGQSHLLILAGLALGSEKLAMGLIFLGGSLAAAAVACLGRRWMSREWAWLAALVFLLTPVVFWQMSGSGSPDIWAVFFATLGVAVTARLSSTPRPWESIVVGALAGAVAGARYFGLIVAASMAVAFVAHVRRLNTTALFMTGSLGAGIWPYVRNAIWSHDALFPYLSKYLAPGRVSDYRLASFARELNMHGTRNPLKLLLGSAFAGVSPDAALFEFLGALVLAFAPLLMFAPIRSPLRRTALIVWLGSTIGIGLRTETIRYLVPVFGIALAATLAAAYRLQEKPGWRLSRAASLASIVFAVLFGAAGLLLYTRPALAAATGLVSREEYLQRRAPDYEITQFINRTLAGKAGEKTVSGKHETSGDHLHGNNTDKLMVFIQHPYYLRVPFVFGSPRMSWDMNPNRLRTAGDLLSYFHERRIRWILRPPEYPDVLAAQFLELERNGQLVPIAQSEVSTFQGMRVYGVREEIAAVILEVK